MKKGYFYILGVYFIIEFRDIAVVLFCFYYVILRNFSLSWLTDINTASATIIIIYYVFVVILILCCIWLIIITVRLLLLIITVRFLLSFSCLENIFSQIQMDFCWMEFLLDLFSFFFWFLFLFSELKNFFAFIFNQKDLILFDWFLNW